MLGPLVNRSDPVKPIFAHEHCALSARLSKISKNQYFNISKMAEESRQQVCTATSCFADKRDGAAISCSTVGCQERFHFTCSTHARDILNRLPIFITKDVQLKKLCVEYRRERQVKLVIEKKSSFLCNNCYAATFRKSKRKRRERRIR